MKWIRKRIVISIICILLYTITFSGCISPNDFPISSEEPTKNPHDPRIVINPDDDARVTWITFISGKHHINYERIFTDNNKSKIIYKKHLFISKLIIDSEGYLYFFSTGGGDIEYFKMNDNGNIIFNKTIPNSEYNADTLTSTNRFDITIDKEDNIHIIWINTNLTASYTKLNNNGTILISKWLKNFIKNIPILYHSLNIKMYAIIDSQFIFHCVWQNGYNTFDTNQYITGKINKTLSGSAIKTDSLGNIYIRSGKYVKKIDSNGTFLFKENLSDLRVIPGYPVIEGEDGNYIYLGENGCIDSNNNFHIVTERVETKSGIGRDEYDYHTIYYSKIGKNGTVIIDNMIIDSDDDSNLEKTKDAIEFVILSLLIAVPVVFIIIILKFKKSNKTRRKNINQNQKKI